MAGSDSLLLVTVDCLRADHVGAYGYSRNTTPNIDSLAEDGVRFENAYSNGAGTRFAFKSVNGGVYPLRYEGAGLPVEWGTTTAELLSDHGYRTGGFVNNPFLTSYFNHDRGFDTWHDVSYWESDTDTSAQAFESVNSIASKISNRLSDGILYRTLKRMYNKTITAAEVATGEIGKTDEVVVDEALSWLDDVQQSNDPLFLWVHLMDAHHPYNYDEAYREELGIETDHVRNPNEELTPGSTLQQAVIDSYDTGIRRTDEQIGRLVERVSDDCFILCTGDHGEEFGEHDRFHTASGYNSMSRVPLVISPSRDADVVDTAVSHIDIAPTFAAVASIETPSVWDGTDLRAVQDDGDRTVIVELETPVFMRCAVVQPPWKLIYENDYDAISEELYNIRKDPEETEEVADAHPAVLEDLQDALNAHLDTIFEDRIQCEHPMWDPSDHITEFDGSNRDPGEEDRESGDLAEEDVEKIEEQLEHLGYK